MNSENSITFSSKEGAPEDVLFDLQRRMEFARRSLSDHHLSPRQLDITMSRNHGNGSVNGLNHKDYCLSGEGMEFHFSRYSWEQFCKAIKIPHRYLLKLKKDGNEKLLLENIRHCLHTSGYYKVLLRARTINGRDHLRGLLHHTYNRLDCIAVVASILRLLNKSNFKFTSCQVIWDGDELQIKLFLEGKEKLLSDVGDECLTGINIVVSDLGRMASIKIELLFLRLICTNGMTVERKKYFQIPMELSGMITTQFPNQLPPFPLPKEMGDKLDQVLELGMQTLLDESDTSLTELRNHLESTFAQDLSLGNEEEVRESLAAILEQSGLRLLGGISIDLLYQAYLQEMRDFPESEGTAYVLFNAITRYASNSLQRLPREIAQMESDSPRRHSRRTQLDRSFGDNLDLSHRITTQVARVSSPNFNWDKIREKVSRKLQGPNV